MFREEGGSRMEEKRQREKIRCPHCGREGENATECLRCGIIFRQYQGGYVSQAKGAGFSSGSITFYDTEGERRQFLSLALLVALLAGILYYNLHVSADVRHPPGILVSAEPEQVIIKNGSPWRDGDRVYVPLARFHLEARVLGAERYRFDRMADFCPVDLALGWGPMSDQNVLDQLEIAQSSRRFFLTSLGCSPPLPWPIIMSHSSNMHMIPANGAVKKSLQGVRAGEIIEIEGFLMGIQERGCWAWFSSLSRTDTGDGACEIVWVEHLTRRRN